jgi:hypothetical protein
VEWLPNSGYEDGFLRFMARDTVFSKLPPEKDPFALDLWGSARRDLLTALVATAVTARLPHPSTRTGEYVPSPPPRLQAAARDAVPPQRRRPPLAGSGAEPEDHDVLLRRLRELGELHRDGVLTDEEFAATKAAVLRGF